MFYDSSSPRDLHTITLTTNHSNGFLIPIYWTGSCHVKMANKMYKVVAEELKKEEEDMVEPDVEL